jgi:hypothetical protein
VKDAQLTWRYRMPTSVAQEIKNDGVCPRVLKTPLPGLEMVHVFVVRRSDLSKLLHRVRELLMPSGILWVSWPKKAARVPTDVSEDVVRAEAFPLGLVDVKVCAVDETWSGLKLVLRKSERVKI